MIRGQLLEWCRLYLSDRCLYVSVSGYQSEQCQFFFPGVPQGSILRSFLFLNNINDLNLIFLYADENTVYMIEDSFDSLKRKINFEFGKLDKRLCANKLFLNILISKFSMF